ncbi:MAG: GAF domain-containing protein [Bacillota bacterium]
MTLRTWVLWSATLLVAGACIAFPFIPQSAPPVEIRPLYQQKAYSLHPSSLGLPMPAELHEGDVVYPKDMDLSTRLAFSVGAGNLPAGATLDLPVSRDGKVQHVQVRAMPIRLESSTLVYFLLGYSLALLMAALGLLLLWRGSNEAAAGVALWCLSSLASSIISDLPLPLPYGGWFNWASSILEIGGTLVGLYLVADGLTAGALSPETRRRWRWRFIASLAVYYALMIGYNGYAIATGLTSLLVLNIVVWLHIWIFIIPLIVMVLGYRPATDIDRARIRWILFSLVGLLLSYVGGSVAFRFGIPGSAAQFILTALTGMAFAGFAYAVLRHRLVSLQVVLNRALVYGLLTSLVVGVFAALLSFLEHNAINSQTNQFLALLIPLVLGMGINSLKRKVDDYINAAFFRRRHRAIAELTQFARTCSLIEDPDKLLDLAAESLYRNSGAQGVAVYAMQKGKAGPKQARKQGPLPFPEKIGNDDLALLRLRAGDAEVDLHGTFSRIESEGYAYPLTVRGELLGFIVVGPRPAEAYSLEERRLFTLASQQVGIALHTLRLQEQQKLLQAIAKGAYKSLPKARAKAKALVEATAA